MVTGKLQEVGLVISWLRARHKFRGVCLLFGPLIKKPRKLQPVTVTLFAKARITVTLTLIFKFRPTAHLQIVYNNKKKLTVSNLYFKNNIDSSFVDPLTKRVWRTLLATHSSGISEFSVFEQIAWVNNSMTPSYRQSLVCFVNESVFWQTWLSEWFNQKDY